MNKPVIPSPIRPRAIVFGLFLIYINCYWTVFLEAIWYAWPTDAVPFSTVIVLMFAVWLVNLPLSRYAPNLALNYGELITLYIMTSLSSAIANWNMLAGAVPVAGHAYWFATPENEWKASIWRYLPNWLTISNRAVLQDYYQGESTFFTGVHLKGWAKPILAWSAFASAFFGSTILICVLLRKQWTERERLTFPVIQMPLEMLNTQSGFFRSRLMWAGFVISGGIVLVNSVHFFYPSVPSVPVKRQNIDYLFSQKPWNAITPIKMTRWYGEAPYTRLQRQLSFPTSTDRIAVGFMGIGAVVASFLMVMRMQFIWWPFHALGYILASSWAMYNLWSCVLISWLAKWLILKQGGLKAYRSAMPFFWGLILGDFLVGGIWLAIGILFDMNVYVFYL